MGNVKKFQHKNHKGYESISRNMLQNTEVLSLQAIGLISYLQSLSDTWELHKTELYKRFAKNGERSVNSAWKELLEAGYIVQFKIRKGGKYEYKYYYYHEPFSKEDIESIETDEGYNVWDGKKGSCSTKLGENKSAKEMKNQESDCAMDSENNSERSLKTKKEYMKEAFYKNIDYIPEEISDMLNAFFGNDTEKSQKYYSIISRAKKKVELEIDYVIWLEHEEQALNAIIQAFSLAVRKVEKERNIENVEAYIFAAVYNALSQCFSNYSTPTNSPLYNWLEEDPH